MQVDALTINPGILLSNEATTSIASKAELLIQDALEKLLKNRTSLLVIHQPSTTKNAANLSP